MTKQTDEWNERATRRAITARRAAVSAAVDEFERKRAAELAVYVAQRRTEVTKHNTASDKRVHTVEIGIKPRDAMQCDGFYQVSRSKCAVSGLVEWTFRNLCRRGQPNVSRNARILREVLQRAAEDAFRAFDSIEDRLG